LLEKGGKKPEIEILRKENMWSKKKVKESRREKSAVTSNTVFRWERELFSAGKIARTFSTP